MGAFLSTPIFKHDDHQTWPSLLPIFLVSRILSVSPWTLRQWDKKGKLTPLRVGSRRDRRYKKEDIVMIVTNGLEVRQVQQ